MSGANFISLLALCTALLLVVGCESAPKRSSVVKPQPLTCPTGAASLTLFSPDDARLVFEGQSYDLNRIETASGAHYKNKSIAIWNKGVEATITRPDGSTVTCIHQPKSGL